MPSLRVALFAFFAAATAVLASPGDLSWGEPCDPANTKLETKGWSLVTDCNALTYCDLTNHTCAWRGCRHDVYPYNYTAYADLSKVPLCAQGEFCPDESDRCLPQQPVGGACQKDRDDQCAPPPNQKDLAYFLNVNGSICLNFTCYWANVTAGQPCLIDDTVYVGISADGGSSFPYTISRDNCIKGFYCDSSSNNVCVAQRTEKQPCMQHKECHSYNCVQTDESKPGVCGKFRDQPLQAAPWVYGIIGMCIVLLIGGVMVGLWFLHRKWREENQVMLEQYYNEQIAYRQSIMSMGLAKNSLLSLPLGTSPDEAREALYDQPQGYTTARDNREQLLPPNMTLAPQGSGGSDDDALLNNSGTRYRG